MSSLNYKNPLTPIKAVGATSLDRTKTNGVTFSILNTGGFVEVYNITDLIYTIPENQTGNIEYSGNAIPIQFTKSDGNPFSFDVVTLNSDNISSGRRRLGMLAYVYETNQTYQFIIDNYDVLWSAATGSTGVGGNTVVISEFGTTVKNNTEAGQNFINVWTASTIENISGGTSNSAWRIYNTSTSGNTDVFVTGGTYDNNSGISTFTNNTGGTFNVGGYFTPSDDVFTTGLTFNSGTYDLNIVRNDGNTFSTNLAILASDMTITGGTYNPNTGVATFTNNTGGTFSVSGFLTGQTDTYVTGLTFTNNVLTLKQTNNQADVNVLINNLSGLTINGSLSATTYLGLPLDINVTGGTYSDGIATFINNTGGTFNVTGFSTSTATNFTGGTVTGATNFTDGLTANTISATTYVNLPTDVFVTGGTYSSGATTLTLVNSTGGTVLVTGFTSGNGGGGTFTGNTSATCINDIWVSNIHSCSPLFINPNDEGVVYFGATSAVTIDTQNGLVGIGTNSPGATLDVRSSASQFGTGSVGFVIISDDNVGGELGIITDNDEGIATYQGGNTYGYGGPIGDEAIRVENKSSVRFGDGNVGYVYISDDNFGSELGIITNNDESIAITDFDGNFRYGGPIGSESIVVEPNSNTSIEGRLFVVNKSDPGNGVVGIETNNPATTLDVGGTGRFDGGLTADTISATTYFNLPTDVFVTGGTYSNNTFTYTNNTGGTFNVLFNTVTGLTVNGNLTVSGTTSSGTISATTYQNLPISGLTAGQNISITGSNGNFTITFTGGTSGSFTGGTVTGATNFTDGLTADTISATTYFNLPTDVFITGISFTNNSLLMVNNTGGTLNTTINTFTGLSISNNLTVSGQTNLLSLTGTTDRMLQISSGGTVTATTEIIEGFLESGTTSTNLLDDPTNWDGNGVYTGSTITGTYQGQLHYNSSYLFMAVDDNLFIRLGRV